MAGRTAAIARSHCTEAIQAREQCWDVHGGKETENCFIEELEEKRCMAFICCPQEAKVFYGTPSGIKDKAPCSMWAEFFAFQNDARHKAAREAITARPAQQTRCRELTMDLAKCMSTYRQFIG